MRVRSEKRRRAEGKVHSSGMDNVSRFDRNVWPDVFTGVIRPLLRNIRDVRRYATAIHGTVRDLNGQVALVDVLALEAVRVFLPYLFREMHKAIEGLTATSNPGSGDLGDTPRLKEQIDRLIEVAGDHTGVARQLVQHLFPAGHRHIGNIYYGPEWKSGWLKERRVAHEDILRLYLERVIGKGLQAFIEAEQAWARMADGEALDSYLRALDAERLQDVIWSLDAYEEQFAPEHVVPGSVVLLNLLSEIYFVSSKPHLEKILAEGPTAAELHVYLGYSGWGAGQLENEVKLGAWYIFDGSAGLVFDSDPASLWSRLIARTEQRFAGVQTPVWTALIASQRATALQLKGR